MKVEVLEILTIINYLKKNNIEFNFIENQSGLIFVIEIISDHFSKNKSNNIYDLNNYIDCHKEIFEYIIQNI